MTLFEQTRSRILRSSFSVLTPLWSLVPRLITTILALSAVLPQR